LDSKGILLSTPIFLFKNTRASIISGVSAACLLSTTMPATENTLSEGVDVAGIARHFLAKC